MRRFVLIVVIASLAWNTYSKPTSSRIPKSAIYPFGAGAPPSDSGVEFDAYSRDDAFAEKVSLEIAAQVLDDTMGLATLSADSERVQQPRRRFSQPGSMDGRLQITIPGKFNPCPNHKAPLKP
jgi:hypothetical protein